MKDVLRFAAATAAVLWASAATAAPVTLTWQSATTFDAAFTTISTYSPGLPFNGSGDIDEAGGTYSLTLGTFDVTLDVLGDLVLDATITTTGWGQTGTFTGGVGGALAGTGSTGSISCANLGGLGGLVCGSVPTTVATWPPAGASGPTLGAPGAWIDIGTNTITVNEAFDTNGGQIQNIYTYTVVPEPGTAMLLGFGLTGLAAARRRRS